MLMNKPREGEKGSEQATSLVRQADEAIKCIYQYSIYNIEGPHMAPTLYMKLKVPKRNAEMLPHRIREENYERTICVLHKYKLIRYCSQK